MIPSRETLQDLQRRWGFRIDALETVARLVDLLRAIGADPVLGTRLALKGGTALNLCFGPIRRLSVDLDFNDLGAPDREQSIEQRPMVVSALERVARRSGYRVQKSREEHAGQKFFLNYASALGGPRKLEVDLNFLYRVPLDPVQVREIWNPLDEPPVQVRVLSTNEIVAGKLLATVDRSAPRDLYDVMHLAEIRAELGLDDRSRRIFVALSGSLDHALHTYDRSRFEKVSDAGVDERLHPLLRAGEQVTAAQLIDATWQFIEPWLDLGAEAREYVDRLQIGELHGELLFPDDPETADRLQRHPVLLWKAQNARVHAAKRRDPSTKR